MSCHRYREAIAAQAAGAAPSPAALAHLDACAACRGLLASARGLLADVDAELAGALSIEASGEFTDAVARRVREHERRPLPPALAAARSHGMWLGLAAAAAVLLAVTLRPPSPPGLPAVERPSPAAALSSAAPHPPAVVPAPTRERAERTVRRGARPPRQARPARPRPDEPPVLVPADRALALARLQQLAGTRRITQEMLGRPAVAPSSGEELATLDIAPIRVADINISDVEIVGGPNPAPRERQ